MGNPSAAQEPSMEEILASIRQIISEDDDGSDAGSTSADADSDAASSESASEPEARAAVEADDSSDDQPADEPTDAGVVNSGLADIAAAALVSDSSDGKAAEPARNRGGIFETMEPSDTTAAEGLSDHSDIVDTGPYENPFDALAAKKAEINRADEPVDFADEPEPEPVAEESDPDPMAAEVEPEPEPEAISAEPEAIAEPEPVRAPEPGAAGRSPLCPR